MNTPKIETPKNGAQKTDTVKGAAETKILIAAPANPIADRLKKIHEFHLLSERRKMLIETQENLNDFESAMTGESDEITLKAGSEKIFIKRPEALKKCLAVIKNEVAGAMAETDEQIFNSSF